jgi:prepilin peptidase CpaA
MGIYILYAILIIASVQDWRKMLIPNALTVSGTIIGIGVATYENGFEGFKTSFISMLIILAALFVIWAITSVLGAKIMGAGDVKLYAMIGSFIGWNETVDVIYYSIILGGLLMFLIVKPKRVLELFKDVFYFFHYLVPLRSGESVKKMSFAFPIFLTILLINFGFIK